MSSTAQDKITCKTYLCSPTHCFSTKSLQWGEKTKEREILIQEISLGLILTTSSCPPYNQPILSQPPLLCKAALHPGLWD